MHVSVVQTARQVHVVGAGVAGVAGYAGGVPLFACLTFTEFSIYTTSAAARRGNADERTNLTVVNDATPLPHHRH